jgi:hypothetical protein
VATPILDDSQIPTIHLEDSGASTPDGEQSDTVLAAKHAPRADAEG